MKDTANSYDTIQNQQQHSWNNRQHHQQIANTTSVYVNHHHHVASQSQSSIGGQQSQQHRAVSQQQNHPAAVAASAAQFHQMQSSAAHHNSAAFYTHLYPNYHTHTHEQHLQTSANDHIQHDHHPVSTVVTSSSALNAAAVVAAQQHATHIHHQQATANQNPNSTLNHWTANIGHQGHHAVTDPSTLAYMAAYQNHHTTVADHRGNSSGQMSSTSIASTGPPHPASNYQIDPIYNSSAAAAAYGYNMHNAAFFRATSDAPHPQTGPHSNADLSSFWNHGHSNQQSTNQALPSQANGPQRQQITPTDQSSNYIQDPRQIYYNRTAFGNQNFQNFGQMHPNQAQLNSHSLDLTNQRAANLNPHHQQTQSLQDRLPNSQVQMSAQNELIHKNESSNRHNNIVNNQLFKQPFNLEESSPGIQNSKLLPEKQSNMMSSEVNTEIGHNTKSDHVVGKVLDQSQRPFTTGVLQSPNDKVEQVQNSRSADTQEKTLDINKSQCPKVEQNSKQNINVPRTRNDTDTSRKTQTSNSSPPIQSVFKLSGDRISSNRSTNQQDRILGKSRQDSVSKTEASPDQNSRPENKQQDNSESSAIVDGMTSLTLNTVASPKKTTWASIASQPAKVTQPKSLKSKMAASNSVLSTTKHLATVSLDSSGLDLKNGNSTIKSSAAAAAASIPRSNLSLAQNSVSRMTNAATTKLEFGGEGIETSKISWPAMNAAEESLKAAQKLKEALAKENCNNNNNNNNIGNNNNNGNESNNGDLHNSKLRKDDLPRFKQGMDFRESIFNKESNHTSNSPRITTIYNNQDSSWDNRRDNRDFRGRRDYDRKNLDDRMIGNDYRDPRRDFKNGPPRSNQFYDEQYRNDDRYFKRANVQDRERDHQNHRGSGAGRFENHRYEQHNSLPHGGRNETSMVPKEDDRGNSNSKHRSSEIDDSPHPQPIVDPSDYNPKVFDLEPKDARYFIIKSYSEDDIYKSIKYSIWCSTNHGNKRLDEAYQQQQQREGPLYLFFSVNGSGRFCGMAQMMSAVDFDSSSGVWAQSKWQGEFSVKWLYVKDVPNNALRHITLENNEDKPVTNSRDTQEVPSEKGKAVLRIIHQFRHTASIFDDFLHYEKKQEDKTRKVPLVPSSQQQPQSQLSPHQQHHHQHHNQEGSNHYNMSSQQHRTDDRRGGFGRSYAGSSIRKMNPKMRESRPPKFIS